MTDDEEAEFDILLSGSGFALAGKLTSKFLSLFVFAIVIKALSVPSYGGFVLGITVFQISTSLSMFGLNNSIQHFLPKADEGTKRRIIRWTFGTTTVLSVTVAFIVFTFADLIAAGVFEVPDAAPVIRVIAITIPLAVTYRISVNVIRSFELVSLHVFIDDLIQPTIRFVLVVAVALLGFGAVGMTYAYLGSFLIVMTLAFVFIHRQYRGLSKTSTDELKSQELLKFSAPLLGVGLINMIAGEIDTILLGILVSADDVGLFRAIYTLSRNFLIVVASLQFLFTPMFSRLVNESTVKLTPFYERATRWGFYGSVGLLMFVFVFAEPILVLVFKQSYLEVAFELRILTFSSAVAAYLGFNSQALLGLGNSRIQFIGASVLALVNFIIDLALIPRFGVLGAVVGTVVATTVTQIVFSTELYRTTGIHAVSRRTAVPAVYLLLWAVGLLQFGIGNQGLFLRIGAFASFGVSFWAIVAIIGGIEQQDIDAGSRVLTALIRRLR